MLSIFATPEEAKAFGKQHGVGTPRRPLKPKTLARIAGGLDKFVLKAANPFIVRVAHGDNSSSGPRWGQSSHPIDDPLGTMAGSKDFAVVDATLSPFTAGVGGRAGQSPETLVDRPMPTVTGKADRVVVAATLSRDFGNSGGAAIDAPAPTATGSNHTGLVAATLTTLNHSGPEHRSASPTEPLATVTGANDARALVAALVTKHYSDSGQRPGSGMDEPLSTVTACDHNALSVAYLSHFYTSNSRGGEGDPRQPAKTVTSGGQHSAVTVALASPYLVGAGGSAYAGKPKSAGEPANTVMVNDRRAIVAAFLATYYGNDGTTSPAEPMPTVVGRDRIQLVTVVIDGQTYVVTDIAMRMLTPRELATAQGFPLDYVIDRSADGRPVTKADQVKLVGNSVPPQEMKAICRDNVVKQNVFEDAMDAQRAGGERVSIPPLVKELICGGALFVLNDSGGKDSQAMRIALRDVVPAHQKIVVHAALGSVEWPGAKEHAQAGADRESIPFVVALAEKSFLEMVYRRHATRPDVPSWPSASTRQCTSDLKRGPIEREIRRELNRRGLKKIVNCMGIRGEESPGRAKLAKFKRNDRNSAAGRDWYDWLPIFDLTRLEVFELIAGVGEEPHRAYALGNDRLSCVFCIMGSKRDLANGAKHNPELYQQFLKAEADTGYTMHQSRVPLRVLVEGGAA